VCHFTRLKVQRERTFASVNGAHDDWRTDADCVPLEGNVTDLVRSVPGRIPGDFNMMDYPIRLNCVPASICRHAREFVAA
jgi:hypothetical protein